MPYFEKIVDFPDLAQQKEKKTPQIDKNERCAEVFLRFFDSVS
jgi:hypothetical protein